MLGRYLKWATPLGVVAMGLLLPLDAFGEPLQPPTTVLSNIPILLLPTYRDLVERANNADSERRSYTYWLYQSQQPIEVVVERDGDRLLLVQRTERGDRQLRMQGQVKSAFQVIGLPSRVFPGLIGVQPIPPETVPNMGSGD